MPATAARPTTRANTVPAKANVAPVAAAPAPAMPSMPRTGAAQHTGAGGCTGRRRGDGRAEAAQRRFLSVLCGSGGDRGRTAWGSIGAGAGGEVVAAGVDGGLEVVADGVQVGDLPRSRRASPRLAAAGLRRGGVPWRCRPISSRSATSSRVNPSRWAALMTRRTVTASAGRAGARRGCGRVRRAARGVRSSAGSRGSRRPLGDLPSPEPLRRLGSAEGEWVTVIRPCFGSARACFLRSLHQRGQYFGPLVRNNDIHDNRVCAGRGDGESEERAAPTLTVRHALGAFARAVAPGQHEPGAHCAVLLDVSHVSANRASNSATRTGCSHRRQRARIGRHPRRRHVAPRL